MSGQKLKVNMLGTFSLEMGEGSLVVDSGRSKKQWQLFAYMVCNRHRELSQEELQRHFRRGEGDGVGALKTGIHRLRTSLDVLQPGLGRRLILSSGGSYSIAPQQELETDLDTFEALCAQAARESDAQLRLEKLLEAERAYGGEFMSKLSGEGWMVPTAAYYRNLYLDVVCCLLPLLEQREEHERSLAIASRALEQEPFSEQLFGHYLKGLLQLQRRSELMRAYEAFSKKLREDFGATPSEQLHAIYLEASREAEGEEKRAELIREQLREPSTAEGCIVCEYELFRLLYRVQSRAIARSGETVHTALLSLRGVDGAELPHRSLGPAMDNLAQTLQKGLRRGDVVSRCSASQYILLLPRANFEDSCRVCLRLMGDFARRSPHSPAKIEYSVWPVEADI